METISEIVHSAYLVAMTAIAALIVLAWLALTRFKIGIKRLERETEELSREVDRLKGNHLQEHSSLPSAIEELEEYVEATRRIVDRQRQSGPLTLEEAGYIGTLLDVTRRIVKSLLSTQEPLAEVTRCLRFRRSVMVGALRGLGEQIPDRR